MENHTNGWPEWGKHVLKELDRLDVCYQAQVTVIQLMQVEIAMLKVKAGVWGLIAGLIPAAVLFIYTLVKQTK